MNLFFLITELALIYQLYLSFGIKHICTLIGVVVFLYAQAFYIDVLFFSMPSSFQLYQDAIINIESTSYFLFNLSYFIFLATFSFLSVASKESLKTLPSAFNFEYKNRFIANAYFLVATLATLKQLYQNFGIERLQQPDLGPVELIFNNAIIFSWVLITTDYKNKGLLYYCFTIAIILSLIFSFEREPLVLFALIGYFTTKRKFSLSFILPLGVFAILVIAYWKPFYIHFIYENGTGIDGFLNHVDRFPFSLSYIEPLNSIGLINAFFDKNIYEAYNFSYITNSTEQGYRMLFGSKYESLAEYATNHFAEGRSGTAFSMILESLINFRLAGPFILAVSLTICYKFIIRLSHKIGLGIIIMATAISFKLVRTELTTLIKLQIFPLILATIFIYFFIAKRKYA